MPSLDPNEPVLDVNLMRGANRPDPTGVAAANGPPASAQGPVARWLAIFDDPNRTPARWACLSAAIRHADTMTESRGTAAAAGEAHPRGGPQWCELAASAFQVLHGSGAYAHVTAPTRQRCTSDPDQIRVWLGAPVARDDNDIATTVADVLELADAGGFFNVYHTLEAIIGAAQDVGVFGVDGHRVELAHAVDRDLHPIGHYLLVVPDGGPALASRLLYTDDLVDWDATGVDAAIAILANAAEHTNATLDAHAARTGISEPGAPRPDVGHLFTASPRPRGFPRLEAANPASEVATMPLSAPNPARARTYR